MDYLKEIGLTESESRIYLALLKLGSSKKFEIIKEAKISPSKMYEVMNKLINKGLVSYTLKNNVKYFQASPPSKIEDYLDRKFKKLEKQKKEFEKVKKELERIKPKEQKTEVQTFIGIEGLKTVFDLILSSSKKGENHYVIGANKHPESLRLFFTKINNKIKEKKLKFHVLIDEKSKEYAKRIIRKGEKIPETLKYIPYSSPVEITISKIYTLIIIFSEPDPVSILIKDKNVSKSFIEYFNLITRGT